MVEKEHVQQRFQHVFFGPQDAGQSSFDMSDVCLSLSLCFFPKIALALEVLITSSWCGEDSLTRNIY